jgi:hypothetical protein
MGKFHRVALSLALSIIPAHIATAGPDFRGTEAKMAHQHAVAVEESYTFLRTPADVRHLADEGRLVPVDSTDDFTLSGVSFAFARPEVRSFLEHFAKAYRDATGTRLVVTSLTRPEAAQPKNAHKLSVHPAGMAVDLRVPADDASRAFLERTLLAMQQKGLIDVTRERSPAHYHIAVFGERYLPYAAREDSIASVERATLADQQAASVRAARSAASTPLAPSDSSRVPQFLLGMMALAGISAPALRVARKRRASH